MVLALHSTLSEPPLTRCQVCSVSGKDWRVSCECGILTLKCSEPAISPTDLSLRKFLGLARKKSKCAAFRDVCVEHGNVGFCCSSGCQFSGVRTRSSTSGFREVHCVPSAAIFGISDAFFLWLQLQPLTLSHEFSWVFSTLIQHNKTKLCVWFSSVNKLFKFTTNKTFFLGKKLLQINNETFLMIKSTQHL